MKIKKYVLYSSIIIEAYNKQEARRIIKEEFKKHQKGEHSKIDQFLGEAEIELEDNYF